MTRRCVQEIRAAAALSLARTGEGAKVVFFVPNLKKQQQRELHGRAFVRLKNGNGPWGLQMLRWDGGAFVVFPADVVSAWAKATDEILGVMGK